MKICVHSNRGPRGEETPCAFYLGGRRLPVLAVLERWADSTHGYFEVMVDDVMKLRYPVPVLIAPPQGQQQAPHPPAAPT